MQRRKMLAALGSVAIGGATAVSTGAFTSVEAERDVNIAVADDADAYLGLEPASSQNANEFVSVSDGQASVVSVDLSSTNAGGSGLNANAETRIDDLLVVKNQGTQLVNVWIELGLSDTNLGNSDLYFYPGDATDVRLNNGAGSGSDATDEVLGLTPGGSATLGLLADVGDVESFEETVTATVNADVSRGNSGTSQPADDTGGDFATVSNDGTGDFDTEAGNVETTDNPIQAAINRVSGTTVVIKDTGTPVDIPEPLTIPADKAGLELRGLGGRPTIRYIGGRVGEEQGINILAPDVTFENLDFEIYPGRDGIGRNGPFRGGSSGITLRNTGLTIRNTDITLEAESGVSFDSASVRLFQVTDTEDKGDGTITVENSSFASNSDADGLVRTAQFFQTGGFLNQPTPFTDGNGNVVDRSVTISGCTFGSGSGTQAHSGEGQSVEITSCTFTGSGNINGYPEGNVTISENDFSGAESESGKFNIQFASVPDVVNGTDIQEGRDRGANAAARTFGQSNTDVSVRVKRDEFDEEGDRVTVAGPAEYPSG